MNYIVYKTTNNINGKYYIGVHKTNNINDGYIGSGILLKKAIEKYGKSNFSREIIDIFKTQKEAFALEKEIVNEYFIKKNNNYNLGIGGKGGWHRNMNSIVPLKDPELRKKGNKNSLKTRMKRWNTDVNYREAYRKKLSIAAKKTFENFWLGRKHSEETKIKMSNTIKERGLHKGEKNSQYGTCWIYSLEEKKSKKIKKSEIQIYLDKGWKKGRRISF